jgi:hypothetical protein
LALGSDSPVEVPSDALLLLLLLACGSWKAHIVNEYGSDDN